MLYAIYICSQHNISYPALYSLYKYIRYVCWWCTYVSLKYITANNNHSFHLIFVYVRVNTNSFIFVIEIWEGGRKAKMGDKKNLQKRRRKYNTSLDFDGNNSPRAVAWQKYVYHRIKRANIGGFIFCGVEWSVIIFPFYLYYLLWYMIRDSDSGHNCTLIKMN